MATTCSRMLSMLMFVLGLSAGSSVLAQGRFDVEAADVVPATDGSVVNVYGARTYERGKYSLAVLGSYARKPLSIETDAGTHIGDLVGSVGTLQFLAAFGLFERVDVGIGIPLHRVSAGSSFEATPPPSVRAATLEDSEIALGDIRIVPRVNIFQHAGRSGIDFGIVGQLWLPTGSDAAYAGESLRVEPRLALDFHSERLLVAFNAGYLVRGPSRILSTDLDDQLRLAAGAEVGLGKGFGVIAEVGANFNVLANEFGGDDVASEGLAGVRYRSKGWVAQVGAGPGLVTGLSAPLYRVLASVGWSSEKPVEPVEESEPLELDTDGDGLLDTADRCVSEPEDLDSFQDDDGCPELDNDADGVADASDACPLEPEDRDGFQDMDGCADVDNDQDAIADLKDQCPNEPGVPEAAGCPAPPPPAAPEPPAAVVVTDGKIELKQTVLFGNNNAEIQAESQPLIDEIAAVLQRHPEIELVVVEGHTDDRGKRAHNQKLSEARATSVRVGLIQRGIDPARLQSEGYGMTRPIVPNDSDGNRTMNRRVELRIERRAQR